MYSSHFVRPCMYSNQFVFGNTKLSLCTSVCVSETVDNLWTLIEVTAVGLEIEDKG